MWLQHTKLFVDWQFSQAHYNEKFGNSNVKNYEKHLQIWHVS